MKSLTKPTGHCPTCELEVLRNELQSKFVEVHMNVRGRNPMIAFALQLLCLLAILHISSPLRAQSFYGSIVGTVTDTSGAVVPDATVTVTNIGTDEKQTAQSDAEGKISFVNLVPAKYRVEATKAGFKRFLLGSLAVEVGAVVRLDPALQVGADNQTVQVSAETPLLQTDSSTHEPSGHRRRGAADAAQRPQCRELGCPGSGRDPGRLIGRWYRPQPGDADRRRRGLG